MKTVYIPKGETVSYENLTTERLVVDGYLKVSCDLKAKTIGGSGFIEASRVSADDVRVDDLESVSVVCRRLIAKRVETSELFASENAAVSCLLSADYVKAGRLFVGVFCWRPPFARCGSGSLFPMTMTWWTQIMSRRRITTERSWISRLRRTTALRHSCG